MTTDPLNLTTDSIPDGFVLIKGSRLSNTARNCKIPFRKVECKNENVYNGKLNAHKQPVGILIRAEDLPVWENEVKRSAARKKREAKYASKNKCVDSRL